MSNSSKLGGEVIVSIPRDNKIFEDKTHLRLLREIYARYNEDKTKISSKHAISICMNIRSKYKKSITRNSNRLMKMGKDLKNYKALDAEAYSDKIAQIEDHMTKVRNANAKIRLLEQQLTKFITELSDLNNTNTKGHEFANTLEEIVKLKKAFISIAKDKETMDFIKPEHYDNPKDLAIVLSEIGIGDITKTIKDMTELLEHSCKTFVSQLNVIKDFIKQSSEEEYKKIAELTETDVPTIADVIAFVNDFKSYYVSIKDNEDFIKLDGLTEDLSESINSIVSTSSMLNVVGLGSFDAESKEAMESIAKASIEQNQEKIFVTFFESKKIIDGVFKDEDIIDPERRKDLHYILVMGSFLMFELSGGMLAINLLEKLS